MIAVTMKIPNTTADTCAKMIIKFHTLSMPQRYGQVLQSTSAPRMMSRSYYGSSRLVRLDDLVAESRRKEAECSPHLLRGSSSTGTTAPQMSAANEPLTMRHVS